MEVFRCGPAYTLASALVLGAIGEARQTTTTNLGYPAVDWKVGGEAVAFAVDEASAAADLNGDGDLVDHVVHALDLSTGVTANLGLAASISSPALAVVEGRVLFTAFEYSQGMTDLTGDGDSADLALFVHDPAAGTTINTGLALYLSRFEASAELVAAAVREFDQGYTDLNADGDMQDAVLFALDPATGQAANLGVAVDTTEIKVSGKLISFWVRESDQEADLNADGDLDDRVQHVHDAGTGVTSNLGLAVEGWNSLVEDGFVVFAVDEQSQGADLNGDGDETDDVLYVHDAAQAQTPSTGFAVSPGSQLGWTFDLDQGRLAFCVSEQFHFHQDLNGDFDTGDRVPHVMDLPVSAAANLGGAAVDLRLEGNLLVTRASESAQDHTDLNGDGDDSDEVLQVYDLVAGTRDNLGLHVQVEGAFDLSGAIVACRVDENGQGFADLNGDLDVSDDVLFVHDASAGTTSNLGRACDQFGLAGAQVVLRVPEADEGADLNGDGDFGDAVLELYDPTTAALATLGLALDLAPTFSADGPRLVYGVSEAGQDATDLSGDLDAADVVLHLTEHSFPHGLAYDTTTIALAPGGAQQLLLDAGAAHAGQLYWFLGSISGTQPGLAGPPLVPLNPDGYFTFTIQHPDVFIAGAVGALDAQGRAEALLSLPAGFLPALAGLQVDHAAVVLDVPGSGAPVWASNAAGLELAP